jgi:hypothetical protein
MSLQREMVRLKLNKVVECIVLTVMVEMKTRRGERDGRFDRARERESRAAQA